MRSSNSARDAPSRRNWLLCVCVFVNLFAGQAYAIDSTRAMSQYVRDRWGSEQGFPKGPVYAITQTPDGYLWIGTDAGLVRFDGWTFRLVPDDSGAALTTGVLGLTPDHEGCLWLRLRDLTLVRYCGTTFEHRSSDDLYSYISAMNQGNGGEVLVSKMEAGALAFRGGKLQMLASSGELPRSPVISVAQTGNGDVWMGTRDAGLFRLGGGKTLSIRQGLPDAKVNCLLPEGDRQLWVGTDNGIVRWNGAELTSVGIPPSLTGFQTLAMVKDRDGNLWVGTDSRGLLRFNSGGVASINGDGSSQDAVTALFEDREGNLWIGRDNGIERVRDSAFVTYSQAEGLPTDGANPVFVDNEERVWFAAVRRGLWWIKNGRSGQASNDGLDRDIAYSIAGAKDGVWVGRQHGGLTRVSIHGDSVTARTYTQRDGLAQDSVYSVYEARNGAVWAGTLSGGVSRLIGGRFKIFTIASGLLSNTVASILESADGTMWFATPGGLSSFSRGSWQSFTTADGLPSDNVNCLLEDAAGVLWAGTAAGIAFRGPRGFRVPASAPAALHEQVTGLAEDRYGWLWMSTSGHVLRVNRDKLVRGVLGAEDIREYGLADGLRGMEGTKRHRSVVVDPAGRIWFSLNRGISMVDPARLSRNSAPAIVHIQTILADGSPVGLSGAIHIPGGRQRITFGFAGLSLSVPDRVRFRYLLDGFDNTWSGPVAAREAVYTNVPPRNYRFRVVASNPDGVWSGQEAVVSVAVDPLFWQTWWFRLCVVLACSLGILTFYRLRLRELSRRLHVRFEERLAERTRIAQELHDTLLQGFLSASMQVHVASDCLSEDSQAKPILTRALQLMGQVIEEGRNAVRGLRTSQSASLDLEQAFSRIPEELALGEQTGSPVAFRVVVDGDPKPLHPLLRDEIYGIGREALINAFRHARARRIEIELNYSPRNLSIRVRDDGCGIDPQILRSGRDGHWGLSGIRERAERIGARLHVFSSASAGTEIELSVPGHIAFQAPSERGRRWFAWSGPR